MKRIKAFTLIELLIVVAIIAILAAIAVPNFLEAQTRAKISRAKADMRTLVTAIETYHIDNSTYLKCNLPGNALRTKGRPNSKETFERLSTPIAYINSGSGFIDPFRPKAMYDGDWTAVTNWKANSNDDEVTRVYWYTARNNTNGANSRWDQAAAPKPVWYIIESSGPDLLRHHMGNALNAFPVGDVRLQSGIYDASNGTVSVGSMWRAEGQPGRPSDKYFYDLVHGQYN